MNRFCVKCGKETNELILSLCRDCFLSKEKVISIPEKIKVDFDKRTNKIRVGIHWVDKNTANIAGMLEDIVRKEAKQKKLPVENMNVVFDFDPFLESDKKYLGAEITFGTFFGGVLLSLTLKTEIVFRLTIADSTMKILSNYHEAIIQMRFEKKIPLKEEQAKLQEIFSVLEVRHKNDPLAVAVDTKRVRGGYDILVGSQKSAKFVAHEFEKKGAQITYSNKMIGQDGKGKEKFRHTYCIRFSSG